MGTSLFEADFCLADDGAVGFTDFDVCLVLVDDLLVETEAVAQIGLCLVGDFEAANALLLKALLGEEVEDVLDVLDAVDVTIDINIAVVSIDGADKLRLAETEASVTLDWADVQFLRNNISEDVSVVECQQVARLTRLEVNHRPYASCITKRLTVSVIDREITVREEFHHALHPSSHFAMFILPRHLVHLDAEAREHPCVLRFVQRTDAPSAPLRVIARSIEQMIAEYTKEDATREVNMERLNKERISIY